MPPAGCAHTRCRGRRTSYTRPGSPCCDASSIKFSDGAELARYDILANHSIIFARYESIMTANGAAVPLSVIAGMRKVSIGAALLLISFASGAQEPPSMRCRSSTRTSITATTHGRACRRRRPSRYCARRACGARWCRAPATRASRSSTPWRRISSCRRCVRTARAATSAPGCATRRSSRTSRSA